MLESKMEEIVNSYVSFIKEFEAVLKLKYSIKENPRHFAGRLFDKKELLTVIDINFMAHAVELKKMMLFVSMIVYFQKEMK